MSGQTQDQWQRALALRYPTPNACKFISGDAFLALAMKVYLDAGRSLVPQDGQRWIDEDGHINRGIWSKCRVASTTRTKSTNDSLRVPGGARRIWRMDAPSFHQRLEPRRVFIRVFLECSLMARFLLALKGRICR
jgi:hypothetical protein